MTARRDTAVMPCGPWSGPKDLMGYVLADLPKQLRISSGEMLMPWK